ncbi:MAG: deoxyhypusine synthase family protein [Planctomycetes bacterium]|nr:deoxyhypusine synthase family protein [Planctomycetota bacterium]
MKRELHDGRKDGLEPLESLDVRNARGFSDLLDRMSRTAFGGRRLGEAYQVLKAMAADRDCTIVVTLSGAMTIAKMGLVLCEMIENGLAHLIVSTGALMTHGLSETIGGVHYKHDARISDRRLFLWGYNRVYDTLEMEANLYDAESIVHEVLGRLDASHPACSSDITREIGRRLVELGQVPSILGCAFRRRVPVYIPAFTDSELGLDVATYALKKTCKKGDDRNPSGFFKTLPSFNPYGDLYDIARRLIQAKRIGIFTVGGGVPRNWAQQVACFAEIINMRLGVRLRVPRIQYGVRLCPEPDHWGGLSGCTYSEGVSWGKFVSPEDGGRYAEVLADATIVWPLLIRAVLEGRGQTPEAATRSKNARARRRRRK